MCFIILSHYSLFGNSPVTNIHTIFYEPFGEIGADIFVMISGYFLCSQVPSIKKTTFRITKIWTRTIFYSWIILILFFISRHSQLTIMNTITSIFPVLFNEYWFITSFIVLMTIVPILNNLIDNHSRKYLLLIIIGMLFISGVQPLFSAFSPFGAILNVGIMITSYLFAGYIKKYKLKVSNYFLICAFVICLTFQYILRHFINTNVVTYGILPFLCAASIFSIVVRSRSFYNPIINWIASSVFASYLITSHPLVNSILWSKVINTSKINYPILSGPVIILCLLIITVMIDQIYLFLERKYFKYGINHITNKINNILN